VDANDPLILDTRALNLPRRPGSMIAVERTVPAPSECAVPLARVTDAVDLALSLESVLEGIWVSGSASAHVHGECARCLEPIEWDMRVPVEELFRYPETDSRGNETEMAGEEDDDLLVQEDCLLLESPLRDAIVLELPLAPVCSQDCAGLCAECGIPLAENPGHAHETVDPRWAALAELRDREQ
jgi:uncharacterized protein